MDRPRRRVDLASKGRGYHCFSRLRRKNWNSVVADFHINVDRRLAACRTGWCGFAIKALTWNNQMRYALRAQNGLRYGCGIPLNQPHVLIPILSLAIFVGGYGTGTNPVSSNPTASSWGVLNNCKLAGAVSPVHDPNIIRQGANDYVFATGVATLRSYLQIRCAFARGFLNAFTWLQDWPQIQP